MKKLLVISLVLSFLLIVFATSTLEQSQDVYDMDNTQDIPLNEDAGEEEVMDSSEAELEPVEDYSNSLDTELEEESYNQEDTLPEDLTETDEEVTVLSGEPKKYACWKRTYGRGAGHPLTICRNGEERNGALCYPHCRQGFYGAGPVCWQHCPNGYRNDGAHCFKPSSYGRGAGYAIWSEGSCRHDHRQGCERWGLMWYPKCRPGFHPAGCCVCSPNCPQGMQDIGVSCRKQSYGRGAGKPLICAANLEQNGALCYPKCNNGFHGVGPVCWESCPPKAPHECGAMCVSDKSECVGRILKMGADAAQALIKGLAGKVDGAIQSGAKFVSHFILPVCESLANGQQQQQQQQSLQTSNHIRCGDRVRIKGVDGSTFLTATQTGCAFNGQAHNQGCANFANNHASVWTIKCRGSSGNLRRGAIVGLKSVFGKYLAAETTGCRGPGNRDGCLNANRPFFEKWEEFTIAIVGNSNEVTNGAKIGLRSTHGLYVAQENNKEATANRPWFLGAEQFTITRA